MSAVGDRAVGVAEGTYTHLPYREVLSDVGKHEGFVFAVLGLTCCVQARHAVGTLFPWNLCASLGGGEISDGKWWTNDKVIDPSLAAKQ